MPPFTFFVSPTFVLPKPPTNNPLFNALRAVAPPQEWASLSPDTDAPPSRFRVRLKLRHANYAHVVELKMPHREAETAWQEVNAWFGTFTSARGH